MASVLKKASKKGKPQENSTQRKWLHSTEALQQGSVIYSVKLLGFTEVAQAKGTEVVREAIKKVRFANHIKKSEAGVKASKLRKVEIKISIDSIKIEEAKTKEEIYSYPLHRISYCADDKRDKKLFAFIAKDSGVPQHTCYVFECEKMAEELTLTVGQAFDLAYRRFLEKKSANPESQKKLTEMEEKIKVAEEEKEALRRKIAQLELAAEQGAPESNGTNEANQTQPNQDQLDLLGSFGGFAVTPAPQAQKSVLQETGGEEMTFDPFAGITAQPPTPKQTQSQESPPSSPDLNTFSPQQMVESASKPTPKGMVPQALPPPPTKQSIKAANRLRQGSGSLPLVPSATSPTSPKSPVFSPSSANELVQTDDSLSHSKVNGNPFSNSINGTDSFEESLFDPFTSQKGERNKNAIQAPGFVENLI